MPRKARRRAWGSVTEAARGKKYVLRWVENTPDGRKRKSKTVYGTYREACNALAKIQVAKADDRPMPTIGQAYETWWIPWANRKWNSPDKGTRRLYERAWKNYCKDRWSHVPLDQVRPLDVQEWLLDIPKSTAKIALGVLRRTVDLAISYEVVNENKFRRQYELGEHKKTRTKRVYDLAEAEIELSARRGTRIEAGYILSAFGGCRTGEAFGVRAGEPYPIEVGGVRFAAVPIERTMGRGKPEPMPDGELKTPESRRTCLVPEPYGIRLLEISEEAVADGREWLCTRADGLPVDCVLATREWRDGETREHIPFSSLRNSWRTFAQFEWVISSETLEVLMGHKLPGTSGRHYIRPSIELLAESFARDYAKNARS